MNITKVKFTVGFMIPYLFIWGLFSLISFVGTITTQGNGENAFVPLFLKVTLYCTETTIILSILVLGSVLGLKANKRLKLSVRSQRITGFISLFILLIFCLVSWLSFHRLGIFLNVVSLKMLMHDPVQLFRYVWHIDSKGVLQVFFLSFSLIGILYGVIHVVVRSSFVVKKVSFIIFLLLGILNIFIMSAGNVYVFVHRNDLVRPEQDVSSLLHEYYTIRSSKKTGPFLTLTKSILKSIFDRNETLVDIEKFSIVRAPIITMEEYEKTIDSQTLSKYNVIIILVESMRKDVLPVYQGMRNVMPTVEWLAQQSVVFEHAYSHATHSNYADIPPLSSHYPLRSRQLHFYPPNPSYPRVLFYDILKPLGYQTGIFSSQNEEWGGMINYLSTPSLDALFYSELSAASKKSPWAKEGSKYAERMFDGEKISGELDDQVTINTTLEWLKARDKKRPFAMYINLQNSHYPYEVPSDFQRRFLTGQTQELEKRLQAGDIRDIPLSVMYDQYCDSLAYVDEQIKRLITYLQNDNEWGNTIMILSADTATRFVNSPTSKLGFMIGNGGAIVSEVVNVPLLIFAPQLSHKIDLRDVQHIDIVPTLTALLGLPQHPSFQGINLIADNYPSSRSVYVVSQTPFAHQYALIKDGWQLLYDKEKERHILIDLTAPNEQSVRPNDEQLFKDLLVRLHTWIYVQVEYYENTYVHSKFYPPVIMDE